MADISFGEFKAWLKYNLNNCTQKIVWEELQAMTKELQELKKEHTELKNKVTDMEKRFKEKFVADANAESNKVVSNNLKYLSNHDRNRGG